MEEEENPILVSVGGSLGHHSKRLITRQLDHFLALLGKSVFYPLKSLEQLENACQAHHSKSPSGPFAPPTPIHEKLKCLEMIFRTLGTNKLIK